MQIKRPYKAFLHFEMTMDRCETRLNRMKGAASIYLPARFVQDSRFPIKGNSVYVEIKGNAIVITELKQAQRVE